MKIVNIVFIVLAVFVPLLVLIRWRKTRKRPTHPMLINEWTGALEVPDKEEQAHPQDASEENDVADSFAWDERKLHSLTNEIIAHCEAFFHVQGAAYQSENHSVVIGVYPPTQKRGWWTYVTFGLHQEIGTELVLYSYLQERNFVKHLSYVARQIREKWAEENQAVSPGDTFALGEPIAAGSHLTHVLTTAPYFEKNGFEYYTNGEETVRMLMLHPIAESEVRYLHQYGWDALEEIFVEKEVNSLDLYRNPLEERVSE